MATTLTSPAYQGPQTKVELLDLGVRDPRSAGIWTPDYSDEVVSSFIHGQFLEDADTYIDRYTAYDQWRGILSTAKRLIPIPDTRPLNILDLGSGAGNTFFPLLDLYPNATVVASDLSVPLLRALRKKQSADYAHRDCWVLQLNAEELVFEDAQFDLVVGAAILHHLFDPEKSIREAFRVLKPGGFAVFFEPFETGQQILTLGLKHLKAMNEFRAAHNSGELIPQAAIDVFHRVTVDLEVRKGSDKTAPIYRRIDDKWLFTPSYLRGVAHRCGFSDLAVYPLYGVERPFSAQIGTYLRVAGGLELSALPEWAAKYVAELDEHFSPDARQDIILEGGILLQK